MTASDIQWSPVNLCPMETVLSNAPDSLSGLINVGQLIVFDAVKYATTSGESLDPGIKLQLEDSTFWLVQIPISIRPQEDMEIRFLGVEITLKASRKDAVCWSMAPMQVEEEIKVQLESQISADLKLGLAKVGAASKSGMDLVVYQPLLVAFNLGRSDPAWEFHPGQGRALRGIQMLHMIVQVPKAEKCDYSVSLRADVVEKGILWNTRAVSRDGKYDVATTKLPNI